MKPIDYRNETFERLQERMNRNRRLVLDALRIHGPCTTRELAARMGWDILNVRPRVTELCQLGFAVIDEDAPGRKSEGTYRALSDAEALALFSERARAARSESQTQLKLVTA